MRKLGTVSIPGMTLSAIVTKADGTVIDLGVIAKSKPTLKERIRQWLRQ